MKRTLITLTTAIALTTGLFSNAAFAGKGGGGGGGHGGGSFRSGGNIGSSFRSSSNVGSTFRSSGSSNSLSQAFRSGNSLSNHGLSNHTLSKNLQHTNITPRLGTSNNSSLGKVLHNVGQSNHSTNLLHSNRNSLGSLTNKLGHTSHVSTRSLGSSLQRLGQSGLGTRSNLLGGGQSKHCWKFNIGVGGFCSSKPKCSSWFGIAPKVCYDSWLGCQPTYVTYCNPYSETVVIDETIVIDDSQPIVVEGGAVETPAEIDNASYEQACQAFLQGEFEKAQQAISQAAVDLPNRPEVHQLRALTLFAMKNYRGAAAALNRALTGGQGWNWDTLIGFYGSADAYTNQIRTLEAFVQANPQDAAARFLLGYHYMVMNHLEPAKSQLQQVMSLEPRDQIAGKLLKAISGEGTSGTAVVNAGGAPNGSVPTSLVSSQGGQIASGQPNGQPVGGQAALPQQANGPAINGSQPNPNPTPAPVNSQPPQTQAMNMVGDWQAKPATDTSITLKLSADNTFNWIVMNQGKPSNFGGQFTLENDTLTLARQSDNEKLVGQIRFTGANSFQFKLKDAGANDSAIEFTR